MSADIDKDAVLLAAIKLVTKLNEVGKSPEYLGVWTIAQMHCGPYKGPTYTDELRNLKRVLGEVRAE